MLETIIPNIDITDTKIKGTDIQPFKKKKRYNKTNINAPKLVARDVIDTIRNNKKVNMQVIQKSRGYSDSSAKAMMAVRTRSYQEEIAPVINQMENLRNKVLVSLNRKDLDVTKVFDLNLLLKNLNHDLLLFNGKSTANHSHINKVVVYGSDDFLAMQMDKS